VACLLAGALVGCINAALIVLLNVPPLLATLGSMFTIQGLKRWLVDGQTLITGMTLPNGQKVTGRVTDDFAAIDGKEVLGIPLSVYLFAVIAVLVWVFLEHTRYGRVFYAVGGNAEAARRAGINVDRIRISVFVINSFLASIGGILLASQVRSVDQNEGGGNVLLLAVGAAVIGGTSLFGGKGRTFDAIIGGLVVAVIANGMADLVQGNNGPAVQYIVTGAVLMLAAAIDALARRRAGSSGLG
jgi:simple sugar transport system permease protein